jgi:hypothetical protein
VELSEDDENSRCLSCNSLTFCASRESRKSEKSCKLRKSLLQRSVHLSKGIRKITKDYVPLEYAVFSQHGKDDSSSLFTISEEFCA